MSSMADVEHLVLGMLSRVVLLLMKLASCSRRLFGHCILVQDRFECFGVDDIGTEVFVGVAILCSFGSCSFDCFDLRSVSVSWYTFSGGNACKGDLDALVAVLPIIPGTK